MIFSRVYTRATPWTFTAKPVKALLSKYVGDGLNWIDPFAGDNSPAEWTNDFNVNRKARVHDLAEDFATCIKGKYKGVLFDPPYSPRQISEHYRMAGYKANRLDTSGRFYSRVMDAIAPKIKKNGLAISFGWNTVGFGRKRGFIPIEIMVLVHGSYHNDTLVTVERKQ